MPDRQTDVLIIGAGPTGLTLANLLGRMGVATVIVERNRTTVQEPRAVSIDDESMRTMQAAGLSDAVQAIVSRGYGSRYIAPDGHTFAFVDPVSTEYGFDKRNGFQQPELEDVLRQGLSRFPCVTALFEHEMAEFEQNEASVRAVITGPGGGRSSITASYMVACDGGRSGTRRTLGIELSGSTFSERWLIVDLVKTFNRFRHTEVFCNPRRPCITLPGPNRTRRYEFMLHQGEDDETATEEGFVRSLLLDVGPDTDAEFRRVRVYTFHARVAETWRKGRVFLAGDAAHLTPPFAGQGMNSGLRDAHNLAWKLAEAVASPVPERFLESYETERKPHAWSMIKLALRMGQVMTPTSAVQGALVRAGFRALNLYRPASEYVAQMRYKPKPRFKEGLLEPDGRSGGKTMVGRLLPQPWVETEDRTRLPLDELLPDRPVVLVFCEYPERAVNRAAWEQFDRAGAAVVGLTPEWINPEPRDFPIVRDVSRFFSTGVAGGYRDHAFLVRRDRYVAATVPVDLVHDLFAPLREIAPGSSDQEDARSHPTRLPII